MAPGPRTHSSGSRLEGDSDSQATAQNSEPMTRGQAHKAQHPREFIEHLQDPSLQSSGPLRAPESEADVFWDPCHLGRGADDRDVGHDPNEEGSGKVDVEPFLDEESAAHHDR